MWCHAHSLAADVPARFDARVHSAFRHAVNLQLSDGSLVPVVAARHPPVGGIGLPPNSPFDLAALCVPGQRAELRADLLRVGARLSIVLEGAAMRRLAPPPFCWRAAGVGAEQAWHAAWRLFHAQPPHLASEALRERLARMVRSARKDVAEMARAASTLVGLGPGLTPSGDDALVGWLCAFGALGLLDPELAASRESLAACIRCEAGRTTVISRHYLLRAARGETGAHLNALVQALVEGDPHRAREATAHALAVGATSGADGVLGLLVGLAAAHSHPEVLFPLSRAATRLSAA